MPDAAKSTGVIGIRDFDHRRRHVGDRRLDVGRTGRRRQRPGHPRGRGPRRQLDRHGADLRLRALGGRRRPRPARAARGAPAARLHEVRPRREQRRRREVGDPGAGPRRVRRQPAAPRRRRHRSVPAALAGRAADPRDGRGLRRAAEGRQDPRDRRVELLGRAARGVARHGRAAALGAVALQHPAAGRRRRRPALLREDRHRRHRLLAALPRPALRHLEEGQDVPRRRRPRRPQGLPGRPLRSTPRRRGRAARARRRERPELPASSRSACCCTRRASPAASSAPAAPARAR